MALELNVRTVDKETLQRTISELLTNKKYTEAAQLRSRNFQDQKETPMERALWWVDYIVRNPDVSFLQNAKLKRQNYVVKHSIDVIAFLVVVLVGAFLAVAKLICFIFCSKTRKSRTGGDKKKTN